MKINDILTEGTGNLKPGWMLKKDPALAKKVKDSKRGHEAVKKWAGKQVPKKDVEEGIEQYRGRSRDAYQRDYDSSVSGFGRRHRDMSDEANLLYIYKNDRLMQRMVGNHEERQARAEGYRDTPEQALKIHSIIRSKFDPKKWVQKQGTKWVQVFPYGKPEEKELEEEAPVETQPQQPQFGMVGFDQEQVQETIVKKGNEYEVQSKSGKNLGRSDTKAGAVKRLGQVEWFKKHK